MCLFHCCCCCFIISQWPLFMRDLCHLICDMIVWNLITLRDIRTDKWKTNDNFICFSCRINIKHQCIFGFWDVVSLSHTRISPRKSCPFFDIIIDITSSLVELCVCPALVFVIKFGHHRRHLQTHTPCHRPPHTRHLLCLYDFTTDGRQFTLAVRFYLLSAEMQYAFPLCHRIDMNLNCAHVP